MRPSVPRLFVALLVGVTLALGAAPNAVALPGSPEPVVRAATPAPSRSATTPGPSLTSSSAGPWSSPVEDWRRGLSKRQRAGLLTSIRIFRKATSRNLETLDYRKARRYDQGRTELRRRYAAGWLYGHKSISHISTAELKKVKKHKPVHEKSWNTPGLLVGADLGTVAASGPRGTNCKGVTKQVFYTLPGYDGAAIGGDFWFDSCDTNWLIGAGVGTGFLSGVVASELKKYLAGPARAIIVIVGAIHAIGSAWLTAAKANSEVGGVIIKSRASFLTWIVPQ